jgi:RHS repeat-associated protein
MAPALACGARDTDTMQASASVRTPDTSTTLPAANLFSAALNFRPLSTGKERDAESGNDYFGARYYASTMGRFLSPDPLGGHLENPQTLNKYAYVANNPLTATDPTGLDSYLQCNDNSTACGLEVVGYDKHGQAQWANVQGVYDYDNRTFTATVIGNENSDGTGPLVDKTTGTGVYTASVNGSGVQFSNAGGQYASTGVFINGTPQTTFQDAGWANGGQLSGFTWTLTHSKLEANQAEAGEFNFAGTPEQAGQALMNAGFYRPFLGENVGQDEYRSSGSFFTGSNSAHVNVDQINLAPNGSVPRTAGDMHFGEHNLKNPLAFALHCLSDGASVCGW